VPLKINGALQNLTVQSKRMQIHFSKKDPILINNGKNQNLAHEEIRIDGYKINKEALQSIKKLNPHHKAFYSPCLILINYQLGF